MRRKILLSPLIIVILIIVAGVGMAGAAILLGGGGNSENVNLSKGLVGWWKLDGNAKDATPYNNDGTVTGATLTTDRKGQGNKAYSFDGNDYVDVSNPSSYNFSAPATISAWVKSSVDSCQTITNVGGATTANMQYFAIGNDCTGSLTNEIITAQRTVSDATTYTLGYTTATRTEIFDNNWHLVNITFDGSSIRIYLDGVSKTVTVGVGSNNGTYGGLDSAAKFSIGSELFGDSNYLYFNGSIDDVRVYNRVLSATEITALYESYNPGIVVSDLQKGLVGQWKMDGNAKDATPNSNHGTVTGATLTTDRKGQANKAYSFNGSTDKIVFSDSSNYTATTAGNGLTVSLWIYSNASQADYAVAVGKWNNSAVATKEWLFRFATSNTWEFRLLDSDNNDSRGRTTTATIPTGTWTHVLGTTDGAASPTTKIYFNGVQSDTGDLTGASYNGMNDTTSKLYFGALENTPSADGSFLNGLLDDVRVYNRVLSATEITALYQSYNPGIVVSDLQKGLLGQWKFDGNAKDATPYNNDGVVTGATLTTDRKSQSNKAYSFNGTTDYVQASDTNLPTGASARTVAFWVINNAGNCTDDYPFFYGTKILYQGFGMYCQGVGNMYFYGHSYDFDTGIDLDDANWHQISITFDGTNVRTYKDGVESSGSPTARPSLNTVLGSNQFVIGSFKVANQYWNGSIDDVRIYNRALSATEVTELYESY